MTLTVAVDGNCSRFSHGECTVVVAELAVACVAAVA